MPVATAALGLRAGDRLGPDRPAGRALRPDINYLGLSGALAAIGPRDGTPLLPLNLVADYGGGAMFLAFGLVCALLEARNSGRGQVVDFAMSDAAHSMLPFLAQGAAQAIEDAFSLSAWLALSSGEPATALAAYEAERKGRTSRIQLGARARGKTVHLASPCARFRRNLGFKLQALRDPTSTSHQAEWIYAHDVTTLPRASKASKTSPSSSATEP